MTRILLISAVLIAAMTVSAFAEDTTATLQVTAFATLTGTTGNADIVVAYNNDGSANTVTNSGGSVVAHSNTTYTITTAFTQFAQGAPGHQSVLKARLLGSQTFAGTGFTTTGVATNSTTYTPEYELSNITPQSVPLTHDNAVVTVTHTIATP